MVPGGDVAVSALGKILNLKSGATLDDAGLALMNATPEQRLALQQEENRHEESLKQMGIASSKEFEQLAVTDRASARDMQVKNKSWIPPALALFITTGFFGILAAMFRYEPPQTAHDALMLLLGALGGAWTSVVAYYFGSSSGQDRQTEILSQSGKP